MERPGTVALPLANSETRTIRFPPQARRCHLPRPLAHGGCIGLARAKTIPRHDHPAHDEFPARPSRPLKRVEFAATAETATPEFPFLLTTGRTFCQFNAGTMTMRTPNATLRESDTLDLAPSDAERLGLRDGDRVRVRSRHREAFIGVRRDPRVKPGELFATFHAAEVLLNQLTGPHRDNVVMTPDYKVVAVRVARISESEDESVAACAPATVGG